MRAQQLGLVLGQHAFQLQIAEEHFQRNNMPADRRRRQLLLGEPRRIIGQLRNAEPLDPPAAQPVEEVPQIALVGQHAVLGQVALGAQVAHERLAPAGRILGRRQPPRLDFFTIVGHAMRADVID